MNEFIRTCPPEHKKYLRVETEIRDGFKVHYLYYKDIKIDSCYELLIDEGLG
jgi:hypothetical protein